MSQAADSTESSAAYEGTVTDLQVEQAPGKVVVRFLLRLDDGSPVAVEMRGEDLRGLLSNGHRVAVPPAGPGRASDDATLRAARIKNLTTGGVVELWRPGLFRRATRALAPCEVRSAVISAGVGGSIAVALSALFRSGGGGGGSPAPTGTITLPGPPPPPTGAGGSDRDVLVASLIGALALLAFL